MRSFLLLSLTLVATPLVAQETTTFDFEAEEIGEEPDGFFVIEGDFAVVEADGGKAVAAAEAPIAEEIALVGSSADGGTEITTTVVAEKRGRSFPRFAVAAHGISGYRLRMNAAARRIELVKSEDLVEQLEFTWESGAPCHLELRVLQTDAETWAIEGRAWQGDRDEDRPEEASLTAEDEGLPGKGKPSIIGTPYAGTPIVFDDIEITLHERVGE